MIYKIQLTIQLNQFFFFFIEFFFWLQNNKIKLSLRIDNNKSSNFLKIVLADTSAVICTYIKLIKSDHISFQHYILTNIVM